MIVASIAAGVPSPSRLAAQSPGAAPTFEVASVKPNRSGDGGIFFNILPGGRFRVINSTTREIIRAAYQFEFQPFQIVGGPDWIDVDRFDVEARSEGNPAPEQVSSMVRTLLADRFKLLLRKETRELPIYALVAARGDRRLGGQLRPSKGDCVTTRISQEQCRAVPDFWCAKANKPVPRPNRGRASSSAMSPLSIAVTSSRGYTS